MCSHARRDLLAGEVRFLFQHAEERPPGGARELVAAGALEGVDAVFGAHVFADVEVGKVGAPVGPFTAAPDTFRITVHGQGGHAAFPHNAVDPVVAAAEVVLNLQHIVSREVDPLRPAVVSTTVFTAGTAANVISESAELAGTVRTFDPAVKELIHASIERIAHQVAAAHRCEAVVEYQDGYRPVVNDAALAGIVAAAAGERLVELEPIMGGEDFSAYQEVAPGCFFVVGGGGPDAYPHHHPRFTIDEAAIPVAVDVFESVTREFLSVSRVG